MSDPEINEVCIDCTRKLTKRQDLYVGPEIGGGHTFCVHCYSDHYKLGDCENCKKPVLGLGREYVSIDSKVFHKDCFESTAPVCPGCTFVINGASVSANGKQYHQKCFECFNCKTIITTAFVEMKKTLCCEECFKTINNVHRGPEIKLPIHPAANTSGIQKDLDICSVCKKQVGQFDGLKLSNANVIHSGCFKCTSCSKLIEGKYVSEDDKPYHPEVLIIDYSADNK